MVLPLSDKTRGHGSHTIAALWRDQLSILLKDSAK
jgi:homoserine O-acetyltransferase